MLIGVISDTHGLLNPQARAALLGVELILHAGDVGDPAVLAQLAEVAPVQAVRGNVDHSPALRQLPERLLLPLGGAQVYVTHIGGRPAELATRLPTPRPDVYIFGHSHTALLESLDGVLFLNPGAAGRPRFGGGLSVALLEIVGGQARARIVPLV